MLNKERSNEIAIRAISKYVKLVDSREKTPLNNEQVCADLNIGKRDLKELGLNFDNRR